MADSLTVTVPLLSLLYEACGVCCGLQFMMILTALTDHLNTWLLALEGNNWTNILVRIRFSI